jgi:hypothetical protein
VNKLLLESQAIIVDASGCFRVIVCKRPVALKRGFPILVCNLMYTVRDLLLLPPLPPLSNFLKIRCHLMSPSSSDQFGQLGTSAVRCVRKPFLVMKRRLSHFVESLCEPPQTPDCRWAAVKQRVRNPKDDRFGNITILVVTLTVETILVRPVCSTGRHGLQRRSGQAGVTHCRRLDVEERCPGARSCMKT